MRLPYVHGPKQKSSNFKIHSERPAAQFNGANREREVQPDLHTVADSKEVKKVYRKIASIIHPDKAKESRSRPLRTKLMADLNEAYARKDTAGMQRILDQWHESPEAIAGDDTLAELRRVQRATAQMKRRISEIETGTSKIISSNMFVMMVKVQQAERAGRDILSEMTMSIDARIKEAKNKLVLRMYA